MRTRAEVVIVGAGIVGCSAAHYLTQMGVRNVVVLDQGPLENTGGSTFHAPGLCFHTNPGRAMEQLALQSSDLYRELDTPELRTWLDVGGIEVATTPERLGGGPPPPPHPPAGGIPAPQLRAGGGHRGADALARRGGRAHPARRCRRDPGRPTLARRRVVQGGQ